MGQTWLKLTDRQSDKNTDNRKFDNKKECWKCGSEDHLSWKCTKKADQSSNFVKDSETKKQNSPDYDIYSNFLRSKDCRWCGRTYNSAFSCSGCGKQWQAKNKADHCLAHCSKYSGASAKDRGDMVIKGGNCMICLHHEHSTDSCFGIDQQRSICSMDGCKLRHHPSLHSAPQGSVQSVKAAGHILVGDGGDLNPGVDVVEETEINVTEAVLGTSVLGKTGLQGKFMTKIRNKRVENHKISWSDASWSGGTEDRLEEDRARELVEMKELLKLPALEGNKVLLVIQKVMVKYGPQGEMTGLTVFWDDGSTCSLVLTETAELLGCPGEPVTVSIETVNGVIMRETKLYCVEMMSNGGERVVIKAFGVENISEIRNVVNLATMKNKFSVEVQSQWGKISQRPKGPVHLLVGQEYAGYHPVQYEASHNLLVCRTMFGQGWVLTGCDEGLQAEDCAWGEEVAALRVGRITVLSHANYRISLNTVKLTFTQERDFYTLDDLGIEPARRCSSCKGCKDCSWRGQKLSKQEAFELDYIEKCVEIQDGKFQVKFPFLVDPKELADNYYQVVKIAESEERKLEREGRMSDFNELFQKLQDLGAMEEITGKEQRS